MNSLTNTLQAGEVFDFYITFYTEKSTNEQFEIKSIINLSTLETGSSIKIISAADHHGSEVHPLRVMKKDERTKQNIEIKETFTGNTDQYLWPHYLLKAQVGRLVCRGGFRTCHMLVAGVRW